MPALKVLENEGEAQFSTPAVCVLAHVTAPTLYHHYGSADGLLSAAMTAAFAQFLASKKAAVQSSDPITALREGWDDYVRFAAARPFPNHFSAYLASKARAETIVLAANKPGLRTLALRPPALWGPGDPLSQALPQAINSGQFAFIDRGDYAFATCHVDNVVEAVQCALDRGEGGRAFFITDHEKLTFREFVAELASVQGLSIEKLRSMPYWLVVTMGRLMDAVWAVTRKEGDPPISRSMMRLVGREFSVNDAAARRDLGYVGKTSRTDGLRGYGEVLPWPPSFRSRAQAPRHGLRDPQRQRCGVPRAGPGGHSRAERPGS